MLTKTHMLVAAVLVLGTSSAVFAQEQPRIDRTYDHMYYYGPVTSAPAPATTVEHRSNHKPVPNMPIDRTYDHLYYYGPVEQ